MKKNRLYILTFLTFMLSFFGMLEIHKVKAIDPPKLPGTGVTPSVAAEVICNVGTTDGLLYPNQWKFHVAKIPGIGGGDPNYGWEFSHSLMRYCPSGGCPDTGEFYVSSQKGAGLTNLFNHQYFSNIYANGGGADSTYTNKELETALKAGKCPKYVYVASSSSKKKVGFIFSTSALPNAKELFEKAGYKVTFSAQAEDLSAKSKKAYEDQVASMKQKIQTFKDKDWGNVYDDDCDSFSNFGAMTIKENVTIMYYEKYKEELLKADPKYDFSAGEKVLTEYKSMKCAAEPITTDPSTPEFNPGTPIYGCKVIPDEIRDWIRDALNLVKYIALAIVIVLGVLDFLKAAGTGEAETMKKSGTDFLKRIIAVIILFLVPLIVDLILNLIEIFGADSTCI